MTRGKGDEVDGTMYPLLKSMSQYLKHVTMRSYMAKGTLQV